VDPRGPESGKARVLRGGGFFGKPGHVRSAARFKGPPTCRACHIGFRVAADAAAPAGPQ
jgi:formylglycine-generating enzyme required for sulfatase activity